MSNVGLRYPREMAKLRGVNRRGLVLITRYADGEVQHTTSMHGATDDELREARNRSKVNGMWQDRHWKRGNDE